MPLESLSYQALLKFVAKFFLSDLKTFPVTVWEKVAAKVETVDVI